MDATMKGIVPVYHPANSKVKKINADGHYLFLCNGGDFQGILEDMDLCCLFDNVCSKAGPGQVLKKNDRGLGDKAYCLLGCKVSSVRQHCNLQHLP